LGEPPKKRTNGNQPSGLAAKVGPKLCQLANRQAVLPQGWDAAEVELVRAAPGANGQNGADSQKDRQDRQDRRVNPPYKGLLAEVYAYLARYIVLPETILLAISAWVMAAWLCKLWDRFPHLGISSPAERCGKTRLLELLEQICPEAVQLASTTPAAVYRSIETASQLPTLLLDEAQCLSRRGNDRDDKLREIFCASIGKNAKVRINKPTKGQGWEPWDFLTYCPKVFALIGSPDRVLADRSLPVPLKRKTEGDKVARCRLSVLEEEGGAIRDKLQLWAEDEKLQAKVTAAYAELEPFGIDNDRMAELLLPLQAVLHAEDQTEALTILESYARGIEAAGREVENQSPSVRLLSAIRDIYHSVASGWQVSFMTSAHLIKRLAEREDEPWATWSHGKEMTPEALAFLLRDYKIKARRDVKQKHRGYHAVDFKDAWHRYLPPPPFTGCNNPSNLSIPSIASQKGGKS
jgi:hypothetical protein